MEKTIRYYKWAKQEKLPSWFTETGKGLGKGHALDPRFCVKLEDEFIDVSEEDSTDEFWVPAS